MIKKLINCCLLVIVFSTIFVSNVFLANAYDFKKNSGLGESGDGAGYEAANLTDVKFSVMVGKVVRVAILLLGIFFFLLTIYAGFKWMLSRGNSQEIEAAKKIMQNAVLGLIVILLAYAITAFAMAILTRI